MGVEKRGGYYDKAGALRDMVPNHIMQLISLTAMEPPVSFRADAVRDEQGKILHAIQPMSSEDVLSPDGPRAVRRGRSAAANACPPIARSRACRRIPRPKPSLP